MTEPLTAETIAELERLDSAATHGPWKWDKSASDGGAPVLTASGCWRGPTRARVVAKAYFHDGSEDPEVHGNAALIVTLRNAVPALLAAARRVAELERELAQMRKRAELAERLFDERRAEP